MAGKCASNKNLSKLPTLESLTQYQGKTVGCLKSYPWLQHLTNGLDKKDIIYKLTRYLRKVVHKFTMF
jgi:hypothetical protein